MGALKINYHKFDDHHTFHLEPKAGQLLIYILVHE